MAFAFYDLKAIRRSWTMPLLTASINGAAGFIYLSQQGWKTVDAIYFSLEVCLTAAAVWCYRAVLVPMRVHREDRLLSPTRRAGLLVLLATALMALVPLYIYKDISLGRIPCCVGGDNRRLAGRSGHREPSPGCLWAWPWTWPEQASPCTPWPTVCPA